MNQNGNPFESMWPQLSGIYQVEGVSALIDFIRSREPLLERRGLFLMASQRISSGQDLSRTLDDIVAISRAAIGEFATQAELETDPDEKSRRLDGANILSYNLAADLAPCWPDDDEPRTLEHYQEGIRCADDCLRWREELNKGPVPFSMAWWALGAHRCGMSDWNGASKAFEMSLEAAREFARESDENTEAGPQASFSINIATGWLEFARWRSGDKSSYDRFLKVIGAFSQVVQRGEEEQGDALLGIQQLETAAKRLTANESPDL